jgi:hypothetical protein
MNLGTALIYFTPPAVTTTLHPMTKVIARLPSTAIDTSLKPITAAVKPSYAILSALPLPR